MLKAAERLGIRQAAWGGRQHYLRFAVPETWRHYASAGLSYDATLAHADQPGFRCGTCYDFPVYDLEQRCPLPLRERPLTVMELTLLDGEYLGLAAEQATSGSPAWRPSADGSTDDSVSSGTTTPCSPARGNGCTKPSWLQVA